MGENPHPLIKPDERKINIIQNKKWNRRSSVESVVSFHNLWSWDPSSHTFLHLALDLIILSSAFLALCANLPCTLWLLFKLRYIVVPVGRWGMSSALCCLLNVASRLQGGSFRSVGLCSSCLWFWFPEYCPYPRMKLVG